jgi:N-acylneuraminate cytidylyltransferase
MEGSLMTRTIAIVPARGGSERLPEKNLQRVADRPLVAHALTQALGAKRIDEVVVTSDDPRILNLASLFNDVTVIERPPGLSGSRSRTVEAVLHTLQALASSEVDTTVLVQPTSPLRTSADIDYCVSLHDDPASSSVVSVAPASHHPYKCLLDVEGELEPFRSWNDLETPDQDLPQCWVTNGAVYVISVDCLTTNGQFLVRPVTPYHMPFERSIDIDNWEDLELANRMLQHLETTHEQ